jgi:kinesin family protein 4/21/27
MPAIPQVAALRQQLATLRGENLALRRALASDGRDPEDGMLLLPSALGLTGSGGAEAATALAEALQSENSALELENTRFRLQMVRAGQGWVYASRTVHRARHEAGASM